MRRTRVHPRRRAYTSLVLPENLTPYLAAIAASAATHVYAGPATNPSLPISRVDAERALRMTAAGPRAKLERPVVILGGFLDVGVGPKLYADALARVVDGPIVTVAFADCSTFDQCRQRVVETIAKTLGPGDAAQTPEVDVIGQSMGGLVGMYAALADPTLGTRLNVRRLFTIASPLSGAVRASLMPPALDALPLVRDMRPGSTLYQRLAAAAIHYELLSYTRLDDLTVGERYAAAPGRGVWWVDNPPGELAHLGVFNDARVALDIVRRLRNETPVATEPPAPLPATRPTL